MSRTARFAPEAVAELEDAARWYEQRRAGLGLALLAAVDATVESIVRWPQAGSRVEELPDDLDVRRAPVLRFPFHVAYLSALDEIYVVAVAHDRRRPGYWHTRAEP